MDETVRKVTGYKVIMEGTAISIRVETIDGRTGTIQLVPEAVTAMVGALVDAKTEAIFVELGGEDGLVDNVAMRQAIMADKMIITDYVESGRRGIQVITAAGGIFEFLIPVNGLSQREVQG